MKTVLFLITVLSFSSLCFASDGAALYAKCKTCHGAQGEKAALGVSPLLKGQTSADIAKKLEGYKAGTFGGAKKSTMTGQVSKLSSGDIKALADYISKF